MISPYFGFLAFAIGSRSNVPVYSFQLLLVPSSLLVRRRALPFNRSTCYASFSVSRSHSSHKPSPAIFRSSAWSRVLNSPLFVRHRKICLFVPKKQQLVLLRSKLHRSAERKYTSVIRTASLVLREKSLAVVYSFLLALACIRSLDERTALSRDKNIIPIQPSTCSVLEYSEIHVRDGNCDDLNSRRRRLARSGAIASGSTVGRYGVSRKTGLCANFREFRWC
jgi:hypothetical protein